MVAFNPTFIKAPATARLVRVTERAEFKDCRRRWRYKYADHLVPNKQTPGARELGTAFHAVMATYYMGIKNGLSHKDAQMESWTTWATAQEGLDPEQIELCQGMIANYYRRYDAVADGWRPVLVERRMFAKIPGLRNVYLTGQVDLIIDIPGKGLWIVDHKTYTTFLNTEQIEFSDQMNAYIWLLRKNGIRVRGAIYNMVRKKLPTIPRTLNAGGLSRAVNICTDKFTYTQAVEDAGLDLADYQDFIDSLPEAEFFKREPLTRSPRFIQTFEEDIQAELREMMSPKTPIIPNFHRECVFCDYKSLCRVQQDRGDVSYMARLEYHTENQQVAIRRES